MAEAENRFSYAAIDPTGRRISGELLARDEPGAFEQLRRQGLSPVRIARGAARTRTGGRSLPDRDTADLLADLSILLEGGADIRTALGVVGDRADKPRLRTACKTLVARIGGGGALDLAFGEVLGHRHAFVAALVAAGEASGDLAGALGRAAQMLQARLKLQEQLASSLTYPAFVFVTAMIGLAIILLFVIPSLAPLAEEAGAAMPTPMRVLMALSDFARVDPLPRAILGAVAMGGLLTAWRMGWLAWPISLLALDGPARRTTRGLTYGAFAVALGNMLAAGAPVSEALRLAVRTLRSPVARHRLEAVTVAVRQGESLSDSLSAVRGFPRSVVRLASIGEASGALGPMLGRAGAAEEAAALRRIERAGRLIGPAMIVMLGGLIGLLMASLLTGIAGLGEAALR